MKKVQDMFKFFTKYYFYYLVISFMLIQMPLSGMQIKDVLEKIPFKHHDGFNQDSKGFLIQLPTGKRIDASYKQMFKNNRFVIDMRSKESVSNIVVGYDFELISNDFKILDKEFKDMMKYDFRVATKKNNVVKFDFYENDTFLKSQDIDYPKLTIDTSSIYPLFMWLSNQKKLSNFEMPFVIQGTKMRTVLEVSRRIVTDIFVEEKKYRYPESLKNEVRDILSDYGQIYLYECRVSGPSRLFYPHAHYYAYQANYPYHLLAAWGGAYKQAYFQLMVSK